MNIAHSSWTLIISFWLSPIYIYIYICNNCCKQDCNKSSPYK